MSILKSLGLKGFDKLTESYDFIIKGFTFNSKANTFTHVRHDDLAEYRKVTVNAYKTLAKNVAKVKVLNKVEDTNRALQYDYNYYDIFDLVIVISELYSNIEIYNLYKKMGKEPKLECVPFTNPTLEELQLLTLNAIGVFAKKSLEKI